MTWLIFKTAWWLSAGKELSSWLSICIVILDAIRCVCLCPFYIFGWMLNLIVSVPDHCLFIYFTLPANVRFKAIILLLAISLKTDP